MVPRRPRKDAEEVQRIGLIGAEAQNLGIAALRIHHAPGTVVLHGAFQDPDNGRGRSLRLGHSSDEGGVFSARNPSRTWGLGLAQADFRAFRAPAMV
jgi:hypothetical protein